MTLIGINEDWSYSICPLGLIATDLRAPFIEDDFVNSLLGGNRYTFIDFKGNQRVKLPTNKPLIDGYALLMFLIGMAMGWNVMLPLELSI